MAFRNHLNTEDASVYMFSSVDVFPSSSCRDVGCIFFEMACGRPMFPGSNVEDELMLIWKVSMHKLMSSASQSLCVLLYE